MVRFAPLPRAPSAREERLFAFLLDVNARYNLNLTLRVAGGWGHGATGLPLPGCFLMCCIVAAFSYHVSKKCRPSSFKIRKAGKFSYPPGLGCMPVSSSSCEESNPQSCFAVMSYPPQNKLWDTWLSIRIATSPWLWQDIIGPLLEGFNVSWKSPCPCADPWIPVAPWGGPGHAAWARGSAPPLPSPTASFPNRS